MRLRSSALLAIALVFLAAAARMPQRSCRPATAFPSSRPSPAARPSAPRRCKTTFEAKYRKVYALLKNDKKLRSKISEAAAAYGIDPMHIVGAIVGEHTYNVDAYDRLQTYYVKAVSYLDAAISLQLRWRGRRRLRRSGRNFPPATTPRAATICGPAAKRVWNSDLPRQEVGGTAFPNDRFSATFFQPFYAGQTFGLGQLNPLTALQMSDSCTASPACRRSTASDPQRRLQDHHGSGPDAALCRGDAEEIDRCLQVDRRLRHFAESRASPRRSTMSAIRKRAPMR